MLKKAKSRKKPLKGEGALLHKKLHQRKKKGLRKEAKKPRNKYGEKKKGQKRERERKQSLDWGVSGGKKNGKGENPKGRV